VQNYLNVQNARFRESSPYIRVYKIELKSTRERKRNEEEERNQITVILVRQKSVI
jgi:hypothetical protein